MSNTDKHTAELAVIDSSAVQNLIYTIRGKQVMLDHDLAVLYGVETKRLNESMKRNKKRFPENFCFQLNEEEFAHLRSQYATSNTDEGAGGRRYLPFAYTEQGISMLSAVLRSDQAIAVSIGIMNAFIEMRHFIATNAMMFDRIKAVELSQLEYKKDTDAKFDRIFDYISEHEESDQKLYFDGQIYDAFSLLATLISKATKNIVLIDGYVDTGTLDLLSKKKKNIPVTIYTFKRGNKLTGSEIQKFNTQYPTIDVKINETFHDRFLILDNSICYHIGASLKDAGKKSFALGLLKDSKIVNELLNRL